MTKLIANCFLLSNRTSTDERLQDTAGGEERASVLYAE